MQRLVSILLLPLLLVFNLQWALEVFHPLEEELGFHQYFSNEEPYLHAPSPGEGENHSQHCCSHAHSNGALSERVSVVGSCYCISNGEFLNSTLLVRFTPIRAGRAPPAL